MGLSDKQRAFVNQYLVDRNATKAAVRAGYSPGTARQQGSRLLTNDDIQEEIKARTAEEAMTAEEVIKRLGEHARGDMGDFLDIGSMGFVIDLDSAKRKGLTHLIKKVKLRTQTTTSKDGIETETHDMEIELYDAQAALEKLARYHGLFKGSGDEDKNVNITVTLKGQDV